MLQSQIGIFYHPPGESILSRVPEIYSGNDSLDGGFLPRSDTPTHSHKIQTRGWTALSSRGDVTSLDHRLDAGGTHMA